MSMTVYELIQELAQFDANTKVEFHVKAEFSTDVEAEFDRSSKNDVQEVTVDAEFDEDVDYDDITETARLGIITINLSY